MPNSTTNTAQGVPNSNGINNTGGQQMPVNHQYTATAGMDMPQGYHQQQPGYASPSGGRQQQFSPHFQQGFGFDPDIDDMFNDAGIRSHFDRMRDPFGTFGSRKRSGNKNPLHSVSPSYYDDDDADFPQFGSLGRRRAGGGAGGIPAATDGIQRDDFFERLPPEFRQFIPDTFGMRRGGGGVSGSGATESPRIHTQQPQYYQTYVQPGTTPPQVGLPRSPSGLTRNVCDAAIQTEDPSGGRNQSEVDGHLNADNLNQHGLRNTVDMGVKTAPEDEGHNPRSHSAPPQQQEQMYPHEVPIQQQQQQPVYHSQGTGTQRNTPPPAQQQRQYPQNQQPPQFPKTYYPPQNQPHTQQQPTAPQTPGGSYIRTIPIFVEGRSEPLISQREIPQTEAQPTQTFAQAKAQAQAQQHAPQQQFHAQQAPHNQQSRPTPINTQQQPTAAQQQQQGPPPATPHTMDSINKIQDIQRDVLNLMTEVEKFGGQRRDKEYAYLDEMLTRNLLKLDTIDTQGKESIRLARKEAIKCIQASINVLEAKAEENAKTAQPQEAVIGNDNVAAASTEDTEPEPADATNIQEPIPLPPPESLKTNTNKSSENVPTTEATNQSKSKEASPAKEISAETTTTTATVTKSGSGSSSKGESAADGKIE